MTLLKEKGVSVINGHANKIDENGDLVFTRSFITDETDLDDPHYKAEKMCHFLDQAYEKLLELNGDEYADYALPVDKPVITPFLNNDSLCQQVVVTFITTLPGRKELH
ncbi:hypothetical protein OA950_00875 [Candidatus Pelagibacter sp.]|nr:hypothetical protein [Candidatus Pelagibacter sp.]